MKVVSITQNKIMTDIIGNPSTYKTLLKNLIIEGLIKLFEEKVIIKYLDLYPRCLKRDEAIVESLLPTCKKEY